MLRNVPSAHASRICNARTITRPSVEYVRGRGDRSSITVTATLRWTYGMKGGDPLYSRWRARRSVTQCHSRTASDATSSAERVRCHSAHDLVVDAAHRSRRHFTGGAFRAYDKERLLLTLNRLAIAGLDCSVLAMTGDDWGCHAGDRCAFLSPRLRSRPAPPCS
jgi:hypothetical protein